MTDECGQSQRDQMGYICDVCGEVIEIGREVWPDSYAPKGEPQEVPAHENCRHHTCRNMTEKKT